MSEITRDSRRGEGLCERPDLTLSIHHVISLIRTSERVREIERDETIVLGSDYGVHSGIEEGWKRGGGHGTC